MRNEYLNDESLKKTKTKSYDEDIHFPILICLQLL